MTCTERRIGKGTRVRLKPEVADGDRSVAEVTLLLTDIEGGLRLSERLNGFLFWNEADVEIVEAAG